MTKELIVLFISSVLINNFVFHYFLGICPFIGVSNKLESAIGMGASVIFVMTLTGTITWMINEYLLAKFNLMFLEYVTFIIVIAVLVQIVEMFIRKTSPALYKALGIYLPLITTNCTILGVALFIVLKKYSFLEAVIFSFASGLGFSMALVIMASIREEMEFNDVPESLKGAGITLIMAGILALAFMGFNGIFSS